jgi:hypothetical protein
MPAWGNLWHGLPAREIGIHRQDADATKKFSPKPALNLLGSKADSVEPKAKKPGSLSDH